MGSLTKLVFPKPCRRRHTCTLGNYRRPFFQVTFADGRKLGFDEKQHPFKIFALSFGYFNNLSVDSFNQFRYPPFQNRSNPKKPFFYRIFFAFTLLFLASQNRFILSVKTVFSSFFPEFIRSVCKQNYTFCINKFSLICVENRVEKVDNPSRKACFINISLCGKLLFFFFGIISCL